MGKFCEKCGYQLPNEALFCPKCGTKAKSEHSASSTGGVAGTSFHKLTANNNGSLKAKIMIVVVVCIILIAFICAASDIREMVEKDNQEHFDKTTGALMRENIVQAALPSKDDFKEEFESVLQKYNSQTGKEFVIKGYEYRSNPNALFDRIDFYYGDRYDTSYEFHCLADVVDSKVESLGLLYRGELSIALSLDTDYIKEACLPALVFHPDYEASEFVDLLSKNPTESSVDYEHHYQMIEDGVLHEIVFSNYGSIQYNLLGDREKIEEKIRKADLSSEDNSVDANVENEELYYINDGKEAPTREVKKLLSMVENQPFSHPDIKNGKTYGDLIYYFIEDPDNCYPGSVYPACMKSVMEYPESLKRELSEYYPSPPRCDVTYSIYLPAEGNNQYLIDLVFTISESNEVIFSCFGMRDTDQNNIFEHDILLSSERTVRSAFEEYAAQNFPALLSDNVQLIRAAEEMGIYLISEDPKEKEQCDRIMKEFWTSEATGEDQYVYLGKTNDGEYVYLIEMPSGTIRTDVFYIVDINTGEEIYVAWPYSEMFIVWQNGKPANGSYERDPVIQNRADGIAVETMYYSITLPKDWEGHYKAIIREPDMYEPFYNLELYELDNYEKNYSGLVFSLMLVPSADEYLADPSYHYVKSIEPYDWYKTVWEIVICIPDDEDLIWGTKGQYVQMQDDIDMILGTITPVVNAE